MLIPARNAVDVDHEVPEATRRALEIVPCVTMADVLEDAFEGGYDDSWDARRCEPGGEFCRRH